MIFNFLFKKAETKQQIVLRWADVLVLDSNYKGEVDIMSFIFDGVWEDPTKENIIRWREDKARKIRDMIIAKIGDTNGNLDIVMKELTKYLEAVKAHLLNEGYINEPSPIKTGWLLTDKGKLVKELGGHREYKKYRKSEIGLIANQGFINKLLIGATVLAAIMPFMATWLFQPKVYNNNIVPQQVFRSDIRIDSVWLHQQVDDLIQKKVFDDKHKSITSDTKSRVGN